MLNLKTTASALLASSLALAAATGAVIAAPTTASPPQQWTYWISDSSSATGFQNCASEVASVRDGAGLSYLYRAASDAACVQTLAASTSGPEEVVLFKPEAVQNSDDLARIARRPWQERALETLSSVSERAESSDRSGQMAFQLSPSPLELISQRNTSLLVALTPHTLSTIDHHTTFDTRLQRLTFRPLSSLSTALSKPSPKYKKPKYNNVIAKIGSSSAFHPTRILQDLRILTGEDAQPTSVGEWHSRHSATYGARLAARWIKGEMETSLAPLNGSRCEFWEYSPYFAPNVVCHLPSSGDKEEVVVSAHYDSRGTFGSTTAPGGDDDGSGTSALLAIARALGSAEVELASPVRLVFFSGEEQGLVGSSHYASSLSNSSAAIKLAVQMDMLAYRHPGEPLQIAFPDKFVTQSATDLVWQIAELYAPELTQGYTPACCSDHQSFWENDFPATWVFERNGPIRDPMYHNSGDVTEREGYDVEQLRSIAKVVLASLLHVAGFDM